MQRSCSWPVEIKVGFLLLLLFLGFTPGHGAYYRGKKLRIVYSFAYDYTLSNCEKRNSILSTDVLDRKTLHLCSVENFIRDIISFVWISDA